MKEMAMATRCDFGSIGLNPCTELQSLVYVYFHLLSALFNFSAFP